MRSLFACAAFAVVSCAAPAGVETIEITERLALNERCDPAEARPVNAPDEAVFDVLRGTAFVALFRFDGHRDGERTFTSVGGARVFVTTDNDAQRLLLATTPSREDTAREIQVSGVSFNGALTPGVVFVPAPDESIATSLAREPAVIEALQNGGRFRVIVHVALDGGVLDDPTDDPALDQLLANDKHPAHEAQVPIERRAPFFAFPLDICSGCLATTCRDGERAVAGGCFAGQDVRERCIADEP